MDGTNASGAFGGLYAGQTVLVTGHTGFKGAWLVTWLLRLGARVVGYALPAPTTPSLFEAARLAERIVHLEGDVRDRPALASAVARYQPTIVFHLAAQPLVLLGYREPLETFETNVMGTANLLEALRHEPSVRACVVVTSDKCYENREWPYSYRENDAMGGYDPYSASKGCQELVTAAFRQSYFASAAGGKLALASARAGNVIGGGDWAADRIVPDSIRALAAGQPIAVRRPAAVRPWQHVLEPLSGYLWLGAHLLGPAAERHAEGWNFGPASSGNWPVRRVVERLIAAWGSGSYEAPEAEAGPHEARFLKLDASKAAGELGWQPVYEVAEALDVTAAWYAAHARDPGFEAYAFTNEQIAAYEAGARALDLAWAARGAIATG